MSNKSATKEEYWKISNQDETMPDGFKNIIRWLDRELPPEQPLDHILEAGCDDAVFTPHLARRASHLRACDIAPTRIAANCKAYPDVSFFVQDLGDSIAAESKSFDALWCSEELAHLRDPAFAITEFYRVLKPNGRLLLTVPYHGLFKNIRIALFNWNTHFATDNPHIRFFTVKTLYQLVKQVGFRNIRVETCGRNKPLRDLFAPAQILLSAKK